MDLPLARIIEVTVYTFGALVAVTFACFLSTVMVDYRTDADIKAVKIQVRNLSEYGISKFSDLGYITFDLNADLTSLFNWNVKQLFVYMTAEYKTPENKLNQVVLWDRIILRGQNANLRMKNKRTKYYFWDDGNGLRDNKNITLILSYNIISNVGWLPIVDAVGSHTFSFPTQYT